MHGVNTTFPPDLSSMRIKPQHVHGNGSQCGSAHKLQKGTMNICFPLFLEFKSYVQKYRHETRGCEYAASLVVSVFFFPLSTNVS